MAIIGLLVAIIAWLRYGNRARSGHVEISFSTRSEPPKRKMLDDGSGMPHSISDTGWTWNPHESSDHV
jgi:hypothetical protein